MTRQVNGQRGEGAWKAIIAVAVLVVMAVAGFKIIPVHIAGNEVEDAMSEAANFAGVKPLDKLQWEIFQKAQKAGTPLTMNDIKITRAGATVRVQAKYEKTVDVMGYKYHYVFDRTVEKPVF